MLLKSASAAWQSCKRSGGSQEKAGSSVSSHPSTGIVFAVEPFVGVLLNESASNKLQANSMYLDLEESFLGTERRLLRSGGRHGASARRYRLYPFAGCPAAEGRVPVPRRTDGLPEASAAQLCRSGARDGEPTGPDINALADKLFYALDIGSKDAVRRILDEGGQSIAAYNGAEQAMKTAPSRQMISLATDQAVEDK